MRDRNKRKMTALLLAALLVGAMAGCSGKTDPVETTAAQTTLAETAAEDVTAAAKAETGAEDTAAETTAAAQTEISAEESTAAEAESLAVADSSQMAETVDVVDENKEPVPADVLQDGTYEIEVLSSSTMFRIDACTLTVEGGKATADMTMGGTGYLYLYPGTAEEAAGAAEADCIPYTEAEDGTHHFTFPVEGLDQGVPCAAYSKRKELWYDRTLVFSAAAIPAEAYAEGYFTTLSDLGLADGTYTVPVTLEGGSGRASVTSPAELTVEGDSCIARIEWSSPNYDYMRIGEEKYLPVNTEGNSAFEIPVSVFDKPMAVVADTVAMSEPHEINYTLTFDSAAIEAAQ